MSLEQLKYLSENNLLDFLGTNVYNISEEIFKLQYQLVKHSSPHKLNPLPPNTEPAFFQEEIQKISSINEQKLTEKQIAYKNFLIYTLPTINIVRSDLKIQDIQLQCYQYKYSDEWPCSNLLFHGSSISNWYSITHNGLQNYSGTSKMANGNAYGNGIYFSDDISLSLSYSSQRNQSKKYILGVFNIQNDIKTYKKTSNIFVIPDPNIIRLKYLIVTNRIIINKYGNDLLDYFKTNATMLQKHQDIIHIRLNNRKEKDIASLSEIKVNLIEKKDKYYCQYLDFKFSIDLSDYPLSPPIIETEYSIQTINNIYFDINLSNWKPSNKLLDIIQKFITTLSIKYTIVTTCDTKKILQLLKHSTT
jgi:ubiquitin-protein ligase